LIDYKRYEEVCYREYSAVHGYRITVEDIEAVAKFQSGIQGRGCLHSARWVNLAHRGARPERSLP
jgi:hypothetical protein